MEFKYREWFINDFRDKLNRFQMLLKKTENPTMRESLEMSITACRWQISHLESSTGDSPPRSDLPWLPEEEEALVWKAERGASLSALAEQHERPPSAICTRLQRLEKPELAERLRQQELDALKWDDARDALLVQLIESGADWKLLGSRLGIKKKHLEKYLTATGRVGMIPFISKNEIWS